MSGLPIALTTLGIGQGQIQENSTALAGITNWTIQSWATKAEKERYKGKPLQDNYRLLELAAEADPEGVPAKIKRFLDSLETESNQLEEVSLKKTYIKYLEGKQEDDINWDDLNNEIKNYKYISSLFIDNPEVILEPEIPAKTVQTVASTLEYMERIQGDGERYFVINTESATLYIKSVIYGENPSLEIRYFSGDKLRQLKIKLKSVSMVSKAANVVNYELRTVPSIEIVNLSGTNGRQWVEGDINTVITRYEDSISGTVHAIQSLNARLARMNQTDPRYPAVSQRIASLDAAVVEANTQLNALKEEQSLLNPVSAPQLPEASQQ